MGVEIVAADMRPMQSEWLTERAARLLLNNIRRVAAGPLVDEADSTAFATYCCLQSAIVLA